MNTRQLLMAALIMLTVPLSLAAQYGTLSPLHTDGTSLRDEQGNQVVLHGVMDTPSPYFNNGYWGTSASVAYVNKCISYFNKLYEAIASPEKGTYCNVSACTSTRAGVLSTARVRVTTQRSVRTVSDNSGRNFTAL